jgi:hypothetical protein
MSMPSRRLNGLDFADALRDRNSLTLIIKETSWSNKSTHDKKAHPLAGARFAPQHHGLHVRGYKDNRLRPAVKEYRPS